MSWHYLQELGAESSEACCTGGELLEQLKSKTIHAGFYCNGKVTGSYLSSLSGTTSAHSESTTMNVPSSSKQCKESEKSLSSQVDSPAKTYQLQAVAQGSMAKSQVSGKKWVELFVRYDLDTHTWRTHQCLFQEDLQWSSVTLPKWGMTQGGVCWELINWEDGISEIVSGLERQMWHTPTTTASKQYEKRYPGGKTRKYPIPNLNAEVEEGMPSSEQVKQRNSYPTPTANAIHNRKGLSKSSGDGLSTAVDKVTYPTPTCQEVEHPDAKLNANGRRLTKDGTNSHSLNLADTVKMFPTPTCRDYKGARMPDTIAKTGRNPETNSLCDNVENKAKSKAVLNPDWVEWLMGWPVGWTDLKPLSKEAFSEWAQDAIDNRYWDEDLADISDIGRVTTRKTDRVNRLKAIGNGQVAICATIAWELLDGSSTDPDITV